MTDCPSRFFTKGMSEDAGSTTGKDVDERTVARIMEIRAVLNGDK